MCAPNRFRVFASGSSFYLYVLLDIFSRYVVGWMVADRENAALAATLIEETCLKQDIEPQVLTLHSDRGAPMTSKCTAQLLADLGVTRSLGRPQVSDDNPFSEAQFKTLKYHPSFPGRFDDISAAIAFCRSFFPWYNTEHRHAGIAMLTPDDVHHHRASDVLAQRGRTLQAAWTLHPERFVHGTPKPDPLPEAGLDQPTRHSHNRRNESVNRSRRCLKVVDRFRTKSLSSAIRSPPRTSQCELCFPKPWRTSRAKISPSFNLASPDFSNPGTRLRLSLGFLRLVLGTVRIAVGWQVRGELQRPRFGGWAVWCCASAVAGMGLAEPLTLRRRIIGRGRPGTRSGRDSPRPSRT